MIDHEGSVPDDVALEIEKFNIFQPLNTRQFLETRIGSIPSGRSASVFTYPRELHLQVAAIADGEGTSIGHILELFLALRIRTDHQRNQAAQLGLPSHITVLETPINSETLLANYAPTPKHSTLIELSRGLRAVATEFAKDGGLPLTPYFVQAAALGVEIYRRNRVVDLMTTLPMSYEIADRGFTSTI